ncbi:hypothetical protein [Micromonospora sp. CPCC 205556]
MIDRTLFFNPVTIVPFIAGSLLEHVGSTVAMVAYPTGQVSFPA